MISYRIWKIFSCVRSRLRLSSIGFTVFWWLHRIATCRLGLVVRQAQVGLVDLAFGLVGRDLTTLRSARAGLEGDRGVVGTEDLGAEALHVLGQEGVDGAGLQRLHLAGGRVAGGADDGVVGLLAHIVARLVLHAVGLEEHGDVLEDVRIGDLEILFELHRVLAEELEVDGVGHLDLCVLAAEGADAVGFRLVLALFVAGTQGEVVDEPYDGGDLTLVAHLGLEILVDVATDLLDDRVELARLFELFAVRVGLEVGGGVEEDVLVLAVDVFLPVGEPGDVLLLPPLRPSRRGPAVARGRDARRCG